MSAEDLVDPNCDPQHPRTITVQDIEDAHREISKHIPCTPCDASRLSEVVHMDVFLKKDFMLYTGSCKERGARYALQMLDPEIRSKGVIAASTGNHAQALAYHGMEMGIPVTVVLPTIAPLMKIAQCVKFQAEVLVVGDTIVESREIALRMSKKKGLTYINGNDHPHVIAGEGTVGLEIINQVSDIDAVVVPVGGGALIAGTALVIKSQKPDVKIIGVEPTMCASFMTAMRNGEPTAISPEPSLALSLAHPKAGCNSFATAHCLIDKMLAVDEGWIALAILRLIEVEKVIVEGAGAVGLAAVLSGQLDEFKGKRIVLVLSGGNIDTAILGRCLDRGLAADGRLVKFTVMISDRPGGMSELLRRISAAGITVKDIISDRAWVTQDVFNVKTTLICETRDQEHTQELREMIASSYELYSFTASSAIEES